MKTVLIVTSSYDSIVDYLTSVYSGKCFFFRLDVDRLGDYNFQLNQYGWSLDNYREFVTNETVNSIYYRKPSFPNFKKYDGYSQSLMKKDVGTLIKGIVSSFNGPCLDNPQTLEFAENKVCQMYLAKRVGFAMPENFITNNKRGISRFCENKRCVIKPLTADKISFSGYNHAKMTQLDEYTGPIEGLEVSPAYFQQLIEKDYEVKVYYICGRFYACKSETVKNERCRFDEETVTYSDIVLPEGVKYKCNDFMEALGLKFGTLHFIVKDKEYYFLEINPNSDWIRPENEFGWSLSKDIIDYLSLKL